MDYMEKVLSVAKVKIYDYAGGAVIVDTRTNKPAIDPQGFMTMQLPLTRTTLAGIFGKEVSDKLTDETWWTMLIALLYHELGHIISAESFGRGGKLYDFYDNIVNDCNETTVVPDAWLGSQMYFTEFYALNKALAQDMKIELDPATATPEDYKEMMSDVLRKYRALLEFKVGGEWIDEFPAGHPLAKVFDDVKDVIIDARGYMSHDAEAFRKRRIGMTDQLYKVMKDWWTNEMGQPEETFDPKPKDEDKKDGKEQPGDGPPKLQGGGGALDGFDLPKDVTDAMKDALQDINDNSEITGTSDELAKVVRKRETADRKKADEEKDTINKEMSGNDKSKKFDLGDQEGNGHGEGYIPPPAHRASHNIRIESEVISSMRRGMKQMLQQRKMAGRHVSKHGDKLHPPNFYQIKTNIKKAKIRTDITSMSSEIGKTEMVLMFDASGSMGGVKTEIASHTMAHMMMSSEGIREITLRLFGFSGSWGAQTNVDMATYYRGKDDMLAEIKRILQPRGGTDFPNAFKVGVDVLVKSKAKRKYLVILTDGDMGRDMTYLKRVYKYAQQNGIKTLGFGIPSAPRTLPSPFLDSYQYLPSVKQVGSVFTALIKKVVR